MTVIYPVPEMLPDPRARFIQIMNTCSALAEAGVEVMLISGIYGKYSGDDILAFYGIRRHANLKIIRLPMLRRENAKFLRFSWHGIFHLSLLLYLFIRKQSEKNPALFVRHIKLADFLLKFRRAMNIPIIFEAHEIFYLTTGTRERLKNMEYRVLKGADTVICISQALKQYISGIRKNQETVIVVRDSVPKEWLSFSKNKKGSYICYAGSLHPWKGVDILISAMKYLPDERLVIVGGGGRINELKDLAKNENVPDRVFFAGAVRHDEIPALLSQAKLLVLPNIIDGPSEFSSPLKLFEYMASGTPITASDIASFREILTHRQNAMLFAPGNPEALAMRIKELCDNPELSVQLAAHARKDAAGYTYENRAERIKEVLMGLHASELRQEVNAKG